MITNSISSVSNGLLSTLDGVALARLSGQLKLVGLKARQVLYKPGEHIRQVYFPEDSVIVLVALHSAGGSIESGTVGREGASFRNDAPAGCCTPSIESDENDSPSHTNSSPP